MSKDKSEKELLQDLVDKVDKLIAIVGIQGNFGKKDLRRLYNLGFSQYDIQRITGVDQGDVSRELNAVKRGKSQKK